MNTRSTDLLQGVVAGLIAGIAFGIIAYFMGILPNIAALVGSTSPAVGFIVNLVVSAVVALPFVLLFGKQSTHTTPALTYGLLYGAIWWVLGPLVLMPLLLNAPALPIANVDAIVASWPKLLMHLVYGGILGLMYAKLTAVPTTESDRSNLRSGESPATSPSMHS